ncbi:unnamed protein product, partial [Mesorhabditis spiculigera]
MGPKQGGRGRGKDGSRIGARGEPVGQEYRGTQEKQADAPAGAPPPPAAPPSSKSRKRARDAAASPEHDTREAAKMSKKAEESMRIGDTQMMEARANKSCYVEVTQTNSAGRRSKDSGEGPKPPRDAEAAAASSHKQTVSASFT